MEEITPIIYGTLIKFKRGKGKKSLIFLYIDENGRRLCIKKMAWAKEYDTDVLRAMYHLSLEGWECFSVTTKMCIRRLTSITTYYFKKYVDDK